MSYCLKCRKKNKKQKQSKKKQSKNMMFLKTNKGELILLPKFAVSDCEKSRFFKKHEREGLLSMIAKIQYLVNY